MLRNLQKILVPIDFTDVSFQALEYAADICRKTNATLFVLHILKKVNNTSSYIVSETADAEKVKQVNQQINDLCQTYEWLADINIQTIVGYGKIHEVIFKVTLDHAIDLIVMGTNGEVMHITENMRKYVLGTNAYRTAEISEVPIITMQKDRKRKELKKIVLPIDIEDDSTTNKVEYAKNIAQMFGAEIHVVAMADDANTDERAVLRMEVILKEVKSDICQANIKVITSIIHTSDIPYDILDYCERAKADLVVIMCKKTKKIEELILNSEERFIIKSSKIPVLSVKCKNP
jgi:nucleotide-binding universal stress UspA family protein